MPRGVYDRGKRLDKANKRALADGYVSHVTAIVEGESTARDTNPAPRPGRVEVSAPRCDACHWFRNHDRDVRIGDCHRFPQAVRKHFDDDCGEFRVRHA